LSDVTQLARVRTLQFRNLDSAEVELGAEITVVHGANGAGKTNLLEAIYFALTGHACRGGNDRDLIAHEADAARAEVDLVNDDGTRTLLSSIGRDGERRRLSDGSALGAVTPERPPVSVFLPDRLALVKGPPAQRRAHLDRFAAALRPARADLRQRFGRALAQRNALVARVKAGLASVDSLAAWDEKLAAEAEPLVASRGEAVEVIAAPFAAAAAEIGLAGEAAIAYRPRGPASADELLAELSSRRDADLGRAYLSFGPQLDEVSLSLGGKPLRRFGSQGQQRLTLLALLFAEREALLAAGRPAPLMLLDDVLSELDPEHRGLLLARLSGAGQTVITATEPEAVPDGVEWTSLAVDSGTVSAVPALREVA
jgi:DNA replication and repair protein RecF